MAFGKYSYQQLKWGLIDKPEARKAYVDGILNDQLTDVFYSVDRTFYSYFDHYVVVMS